MVFVFIFFLYNNIYAQTKIYKVTGQISEARQMYGSVVLGDYLYLIGGNSLAKGFTNEVNKALIKPDGSLDKWENTTPLISPRAYISNLTIALNDIVYIAGGFSSKPDGSNQSKPNNLIWTRPKTDGHLEPWRESITYPGEGISCSTLISTPGYLNIIAGYAGYGNNEHPVNNVWSAKISKDGDVLGWEKSPPLPTPLWFHCAGVVGGRVWVWGGLTTKEKSSINKKIFVAPILSSGKIGIWEVLTNELPTPFYNAACNVSGNFLLSFCPRYSDLDTSNDIWYTQVSVQAGLMPWKKINTDILTKKYIGVATDYRRNIIYLPGGRIGGKPGTADLPSFDNNIYAFKLVKQEQADIQSDIISNNIEIQSSPNQSLSYIQQAIQLSGANMKYPGFTSYEQARQNVMQNKSPIIVYVYSETTPKCKEQASILQKINISQLPNNILFSEVNCQSFPQFLQQRAVFKVPTWLFFDINGNEKFRHTGVLQLEELGVKINQLTQ